MEKVQDNQIGFAALVIVLVLAISGILGFTGWFVWNTKQSSDSSFTPSNSVKTSTKSTDPYAGWQVYTSSSEGFKIKYPGNWTAVVGHVDGASQKESVSFNAPHNFQFCFDMYKFNANSSFDCVGCVFHDIAQLDNVEYGKPLYVVINSQTTNNQPYQTLSISENKDLASQKLKSWPYFTTKNNSGYVVRWTGQYIEPGTNGGDMMYSSYADFPQNLKSLRQNQYLHQ